MLGHMYLPVDTVLILNRLAQKTKPLNETGFQWRNLKQARLIKTTHTL